MPLKISLKWETEKGIYSGSWLCCVDLFSKLKHSFLEEGDTWETKKVKEAHIQGSGSDKVYKAQECPESLQGPSSGLNSDERFLGRGDSGGVACQLARELCGCWFCEASLRLGCALQGHSYD